MQQEQKSLLGPQWVNLNMQDADVWLLQSWLKAETADKLLKHFIERLAWSQPNIRMFGKSVPVPRLQAWYGDADASYAYSGIKMVPLAWEKKLLELKRYCEQTCDTPFNSVLANLYRHGQDSMGMHADNEPELGEQPVIASVSLGASRNFDFKHLSTGEKRRVVLHHGSLLIMRGSTQTFWHHGISKTKRVDTERVNFTFRYVHGSSN
ncbi:alpha-ketoglutarate-dependent dioxygenase AlkB family protein [Glaciecola siphonariae]|uniref:Alpha-ketoglutarate-dependent dioxygenase AlkB family protein n=1 Tax=Glaciecola siphonariae TaxID=521012 RepID=A0ABV9LX84_9ALTE